MNTNTKLLSLTINQRRIMNRLEGDLAAGAGLIVANESYDKIDIKIAIHALLLFDAIRMVPVKSGMMIFWRIDAPYYINGKNREFHIN